MARPPHSAASLLPINNNDKEPEMPSSPKAFVWYELMTSDLDAAEAFYSAVVGWTPQPFHQADMRYTTMSAGDRMVAGLMSLPEEARAAGLRPSWVGYIGVDNVDAATEKLRQAGGIVHRPPADIPNVGRFSVVADPQGAMFMLFTPSGEGSSPAPAGTPGDIGWRELYAADGVSAFDFYAGQFGWTKAEAMDMGPMGIYQLFAAGGEAIGGVMTKPQGIPAPVWLYYFNVAAIDAAVARVTQSGGQVIMGPHQVPGGSWIVQCLDPQGAMFALVGPTR
jgi:predicted enzyme related to lactoylglutathione lyase